VTVGDTVYVNRFECAGVVRFIGETLFKPGVIWYGIELEEAKGKNNGSVKGEWYFDGKAKHGTFVQSHAFTTFAAMGTDRSLNSNMMNKQDTDRSVVSLSLSGLSAVTSSGRSDTSGKNLLLRIDNGSLCNRIHCNLNHMRDIVQTENDLAGFGVIWLIGLCYVLYLRGQNHRDLVDTHYISIIAIVLMVCLCTWMFAVTITRNRTQSGGQGHETMRIAAFYVPFACKLVIAATWFARLMWNVRHRVYADDDYHALCEFSLVMIWFDLVLAVWTSELLITTVVLNSIVHVDAQRTHPCMHVFLFVTRPLLWVYNRLIVMFVAFYCYYYLVFAITPITLGVCSIAEIKEMRHIGVVTLLLPFNNVLYLFDTQKWINFTLSNYDDIQSVKFGVIQQVLLFTTLVDVAMDLWSLYRLAKECKTRSATKLLHPNTASPAAVIQLQPKQLSIIPETAESPSNRNNSYSI